METTAKLDRAGRLMVPRKFREELGLGEGSELVVRLEDGGLRVETRETALRRMQAYLKQFGKPGKPVVEEFLKERQQEARREAARAR